MSVRYHSAMSRIALALALALLFATTLAAEDSPLVALAKRTNRTKPKSKVITNETLSKSGGHIATTDAQAPLPAPLPATATTAQQPKTPAAAPSEAQQVIERNTPRWIAPSAVEPPRSQTPIQPASSQQPTAADAGQKRTAAEPAQKPMTVESSNKPIAPQSSQNPEPPR